MDGWTGDGGERTFGLERLEVSGVLHARVPHSTSTSTSTVFHTTAFPSLDNSSSHGEPASKKISLCSDSSFFPSSLTLTHPPAPPRRAPQQLQSPNRLVRKSGTCVLPQVNSF
jgi:hypothetical protein